MNHGSIIMYSEQMVQFFNVLILPVLSLTFVFVLNFLNSISTVFVISDIEPIEVKFLPHVLSMSEKYQDREVMKSL